jgi:hypothetical protein
MATDWQMPRRSNRCAVSGREFAIGEEFRVSLFETDVGLERRDTALDIEPPERDGLIAAWRTRRPAPDTKSTTAAHQAGLVELFQQLTEADNAEHGALRFALALLLWRKKHLTLIDTDRAEDAAETWTFQQSKGDDQYTVTKPELTEDAIAELSTQLEALLSNPGATASPTAPADAETTRAAS